MQIDVKQRKNRMTKTQAEQVISLWNKGLPAKEIAKLMDKAVGSIRMGLYRARKRGVEVKGFQTRREIVWGAVDNSEKP